jgi:type II secretory pathway pseudopilin PulG
MRHAHCPQQRSFHFIHCAALIAVICLVTAAGAQTAAGPEMPWSQDLKKYPGLEAELTQLIGKLQRQVQFPDPRSQSRLLPRLPESTVFYAAFPNYGDASHQALAIFRQELQTSPALRDWWQHGVLAASGPKIEDSLEKFYQLSQYLGDEVVVSGAAEGHQGPSLLVVAEVRKPGLKQFLEQMMKEAADGGKPPMRILDAQELAATKDGVPTQEPVVLVRPDFVVLSLDIATLRGFNSSLDQSSSGFTSTPFGQRAEQAYDGGASGVAAVDLQRILKQIPPANSDDPRQMAFKRSGFADMKYLVWTHKLAAGRASSQAELSFTGPRRGVAGWLAGPANLGSLDFVSPNAIMAGAVRLKNLGDIFDDVQDLATASNPASFAMLGQMQQGVGISLKDDLLNHFAGEIAVEVDRVNPPTPPDWKIIFRVHDANALQATLNKLLATAPVMAQQSDEGGVTYHSLKVPSPQKATEISYAFVDGYLIIAPSHQVLADAVRMHQGGESLAKSKKFLGSLPPGHTAEASALLYEDPVAMMGLRIGQASPELAQSLSQMNPETTPAVIGVYAEPTAIHEVSQSSGVDAGMVLVAAAVAIPSLLRARMAANESSAVASLRTVETAQVAYSSTYPTRGFARDLATLGLGPGGPGTVSPDHAGLIDATLANPSCTAASWCIKSGFQFRVVTACAKRPCQEFVVVGTPVAGNTGTRNFCSTSDGVIRFRLGPPLTAPVSAAQCRSWQPVQ